MKRVRRRLEQKYLQECGYASGRHLISRLIDSLNPGEILLDAGCGEAQLRNQVPSSIKYIGIDRHSGQQNEDYLFWNIKPDVIADVRYIPLASEKCRSVALFHILEHVVKPVEVLKEVNRVLIPGGHVFITVPLLHEVHHGPYDYYRYTPHALRELASDSELEVHEIKPSGGYFRALSQILIKAPSVVSTHTFTGKLSHYLVARPLAILGWIIHKLQYILDLQDMSQNFTGGYHCILRKPINVS